jgi:hypothetical protein
LVTEGEDVKGHKETEMDYGKEEEDTKKKQGRKKEKEAETECVTFQKHSGKYNK